MDRAERRRLLKEDEKRLSRGIDPEMPDRGQLTSLLRIIDASIVKAKSFKKIEPIISAIYPNVDMTVSAIRSIPIACRRGCSHCCNIWVSASAPEILHLANIIRARGQRVIQKVQEAHAATKDFGFDNRDKHPYPCPLLENDVCSVYENRPRACRLAASADAAICARSYHNISEEDIPTPVLYLIARSGYGATFAVALKNAGLPHWAYEFNEGLARALEREDAEAAWLRGEDVFSGVRRDPEDATARSEALFAR